MTLLSSKTKVATMAVTGDLNFFSQRRFSLLLDTLSSHVETLERVPIENVYDSKSLKTAVKQFLRRSPFPVKTSGKASAMRKNGAAFIKQSLLCERQIRSLSVAPDFIFHLFGMYCPLWDSVNIPYSMYLDYTMALARRTWQPWAPFRTETEYQRWKECEALAYRRATCIFTFSNLVKNSLVEDYGIEPKKVVTVGASGQFLDPYKGVKSFGSGRILFNASNFERKGGKLVLQAFQKIRDRVPAAELVIVGENLSLEAQPGISNPGVISGPGSMQKLILDCDILLAPAVCEPYGQLLVEAMNYGLPCVVSNVGGMPEVVSHDIDGSVLSEASPEVLADTVIHLLKDKKKLERFSEAARRKVREQLNWKVISEKIWQKIEDCIA